VTAHEGGAARAALFVVAAAIVMTLVGAAPLAGGLVAAPALAVICRPVQDRLAARMRPNVAALVIVIVAWVVLVLPGAWLATLTIRQAPAALNEVQHVTESWRTAQQPLFGTSPDSLVARAGAASAGWLSAALGPALSSIGHGILNLSIALLGLYFLLVAGDAAWVAVRQHLPFSQSGSDWLRGVFVNVTRAALLGTLLSAALQGISIGIGFRLVGNDAAAFWGAVGGFATLVPVVGNALVWVPAVVALILQGRPGAALTMFVLGKVVPSLIDRVVRAAISQRVGNTHPMVTLVGALVGLRLVGAVGILVGPTIVQCTLALIQLYEREYGLPWTGSRETSPPA
jgi:predicted PurR-regulated permease PerM